MLIAIDAMGSDRAPDPEIEGAIAAARDGIDVILVGEQARLGAASAAGVRIHHAAEVVTMDDHPGQAFRTKRDSSLRVAFELVKSGAAGAVVSAGNSGAVLACGLFVLGRLAGVDRPAVVTVFPTPAGPVTLCDAGANVDVKPTHLVQFALLGVAYHAVAHGVAAPRVGILSNGAEPGKGTELTRAAHALLAAMPLGAPLRYLGYVEGSDLFAGVVDVVATDGFTGNVVLKTAEGMAEAFALPRPLHYAETGGALLAGVDGVALLAHGRSDGLAVANAIRAASRFAHHEIHRRLAQVVAEGLGSVRNPPA